MQGFEVEAFELVVAAGEVDHEDLGVAGFGEEDFADGGDVVDAADVGDEAAAGAELLEGELDDAADLAAGAADEDGVGRREAGPGFGGLSQNGREIADAKTFGVAG